MYGGWVLSNHPLLQLHSNSSVSRHIRPHAKGLCYKVFKLKFIVVIYLSHSLSCIEVVKGCDVQNSLVSLVTSMTTTYYLYYSCNRAIFN